MKRLCFLILTICVVSCSSTDSAKTGPFHQLKPLRVTVADPKDFLSVNSLVVMPAKHAKDSACALTDLDSILLRALRSELQLDVIPSDQLGGREVDAAFELQVTSCSELQGSSIGAAQPAAVGFSATVIRSADNRQVWRADFAREEKSFSDDLIGGAEVLHRGRGFRSAKEILTSGLYDAARDLATRRDEQFFLGSLVTGTEKQ